MTLRLLTIQSQWHGLRLLKWQGRSNTTPTQNKEYSPRCKLRLHYICPTHTATNKPKVREEEMQSASHLILYMHTHRHTHNPKSEEAMQSASHLIRAYCALIKQSCLRFELAAKFSRQGENAVQPRLCNA